MALESMNWSNYIFPPIVVGISVIVKDVFVDGYRLQSGFVMTDVGLNIVAYLLSDVIVQFGINRMFEKSADSELLKGGTDIVLQPALHGLMVGIARPLMHAQTTVIRQPVTFFNSFVDGLVYNIVGKYIASPMIVYFTK